MHLLVRWRCVGTVTAAVALGAFLCSTRAADVETATTADLPTRQDASPDDVRITPKRRESIDRGMKWLLSVLRQNGMIGGDVGQPVDLSCTAMVGMALLAEGNTPHGGEHARELRQVLGAVVTLVNDLPTGPRRNSEVTLVQRKIGMNADRFLAAVFLSEIHGESGDDDDDVKRALDKLIVDICRGQGKDGTWGNESWAPVLGTVLGWESLRSSSSCGMKVDASAKLVGEALIEMLRREKTERDSWMHEFYKKASSVRVLYSLGYRDDPDFKECLQQTIHLAKSSLRPFVEAGGEEYLSFFLVTECLMHEPDAYGREWYPLVSERLMDVQNADGSWTGHHCIVNRTFCTAAALMTLQAPNQCLSLSNF